MDNIDKGSFEKKVWDFLGSRDLSVFIFIMGLTYIFFLAIFGMFVPLPWVNNISRLLPFKALYLLFFINLIICEIKWTPVVIHKCRKPKVPLTTEDMGRFRHKIAVSGQQSAVGKIENHLRRRGYKIQVSGVRGQVAKINSPRSPLNLRGESKERVILHAYRGRFSPIGNLFFHVSFLFLLLGVGTSYLFRFEGNARVTEGYPFTGSKGEYSFIKSSPLALTPNISFSLEKLSPRFWKERLLFTDLKADLSYAKGVGSAWMGSPLKVDNARITINDIGITPMYVLKNSDGKVIDSAFVNLAAFVPGSEDHFQLPGFPHLVFISFYPDHEVKGGKVTTRSMELRNPAYFLRVFRGRLLVYSGLLRLDEEADFEGLKLSFPEMRYWGEFRIVKDPGFIFIWIAFIFLGTGLIWRLLFYRREVSVVKEGEALYLCGSSDYYHSLFDNRLTILAGMADEE